jgi:tyrosine decarboxylase / aspartate 1-decarboxylase
MSFDKDTLGLLTEAIKKLDAGFSALPLFEQEIDLESISRELSVVAEKMTDNYPYQHPLYAGQMLKPPHPLARAVYALAMYINPNNHALDGGRASSTMEKEAVAHLASMFGWPQHLGHLAAGGTMANLEALWIARELRPGKTTLASEQAHYTHGRICGVLGIPFRSVDTDVRGRMDLDALRRELSQGDVGTIVVTLGATATGAIDPLDQVLELVAGNDVRVHLDAAYGGYFTLVDNLDHEARLAFDSIDQADSIVIDPHKHGLQPYGCGCVIFRDPAVGSFYKHDSPYTYFTSNELHLGEISLECSRPGASAAALWATQRLLPCTVGGEFSRQLSNCREAALALFSKLEQSQHFVPLFSPQLDIVVWAVKADLASESSRLAEKVFDNAAANNLHLALAAVPKEMAQPALPGMKFDSDNLRCLRSCLMKPEHLEWVDRIFDLLQKSLDDC